MPLLPRPTNSLRWDFGRPIRPRLPQSVRRVAPPDVLAPRSPPAGCPASVSGRVVHSQIPPLLRTDLPMTRLRFRMAAALPASPRPTPGRLFWVGFVGLQNERPDLADEPGHQLIGRYA